MTIEFTLRVWPCGDGLDRMIAFREGPPGTADFSMIYHSPNPEWVFWHALGACVALALGEPIP